MKTTLLAGLIAAVTSLPIVAQAAETENYGSREAQTNLLLACRDALGITADLSIYTLELDDGRVLLSAVNRDGVSLRQARSINRCKRDSLAANPGAWEGTVTAAKAPAAQLPRPKSGPKVGPAAHDLTWQSTACPPRFNGLFRGTLYCLNGRRLK